MFERADVNYIYDGSLEGLFCCVFYSFTKKELPQGVFTYDDEIISFFRSVEIETDLDLARRVTKGVYSKLSAEIFSLVLRCYLSDLENKELYIITFLQYSFKNGKSSPNHLGEDCVLTVNKAAQRAGQEAHKLKGFIRFIQRDGVLVSEISPSCRVLALVASHFKDRYPEEQIMIIDKTHRELMVLSGGKYRILPYDSITPNAPDEFEECYASLWRCFFNSVNIKERKNPRCQNNLLPKKYRGDMTEFASDKYLLPL